MTINKLKDRYSMNERWVIVADELRLFRFEKMKVVKIEIRENDTIYDFVHRGYFLNLNGDIEQDRTNLVFDSVEKAKEWLADFVRYG